MLPTYVFRVNLAEGYATNNPDTLSNFMHKTQTQTISIVGISRTLKHGDTFSLFGDQALKLKYLIETNQLPFKIEIIEIPNAPDVSVNVDGYDLEIVWTPLSPINTTFQLFAHLELNLNNESWNLIETIENQAITSYSLEYDRPGNLMARLRYSDGNENYSQNYTISSAIEVPSPKWKIKDPGVQGYSIPQLEGGLSISSGVSHTVTITQENGYEVTTITSPTFHALNDMYYNMAVFDLAHPILFPDGELLRDQKKKLRFVTPDYITAESAHPLISELTLFKGSTQTTYITTTFNADSKFYYAGAGSPEVPGPFFDPVGVEPV